MGTIVSIIIPTYNRRQIANRCIHSIIECSLNNIEVIVVNDYKESKFILNSENNVSYIKIIDNEGSGVASARNLGAKLATSPILIFVDDDMIINERTITKAINFINTTTLSVYNADWVYEKKLLEKISTTQFGRYLIANNFTSLKGWNGDSIEWKENSLLNVGAITSQFFAIKKTDFDKVGGYNEKFPFAGFEDHELSLRINQNNFKIYIDTTTLIYHNESDRVDPLNWLERKRRGAETRRVAVNMGFKDLEINYSFFKQCIYKLMIKLYPFILLQLKLLPNIKIADFIYSKIINTLLGTNIYKGYTTTSINRK